MRFPKLLCAPLLTAGILFGQGPGFGGPGGRGGPGGPEGPMFGGLAGHVVTGAPYSATKTETHQEALTDGNQISQTHTTKIYRDAEGRVRTESTMPTRSGTTRTMITIFDPVAGFMAHLNPEDSTAMKSTLPTRPAGDKDKAHQRPSADVNNLQVVKADLGASNIAGLAATGTRITRTIPAGEMGNSQALTETMEIWTSTALKTPVKMTRTDPRHGTSSMTLSDVSQAPPDPSLFQIPSSYAVKDAPAHHGHPGEGGAGAPHHLRPTIFANYFVAENGWP